MTSGLRAIEVAGLAALLFGVGGSVEAQVSSPERPTVAVLEFGYGAVKV